MKILINGIPGTGKTTIGNYLESHYGFKHCDVEAGTDVNYFINSDFDKKVITWGFVPLKDDANIEVLQSLGYKMIWFDGNRPAARKAFNNRGTVPEDLLDVQMERIEKMDLLKFKPIVIDTFNTEGRFMDKDIICKKLFEAIG